MGPEDDLGMHGALPLMSRDARDIPLASDRPSDYPRLSLYIQGKSALLVVEFIDIPLARLLVVKLAAPLAISLAFCCLA